MHPPVSSKYKALSLIIVEPPFKACFILPLDQNALNLAACLVLRQFFPPFDQESSVFLGDSGAPPTVVLLFIHDQQRTMALRSGNLPGPGGIGNVV